MVAVNSTMLALGTSAPDFNLPSATDGTVYLKDFADARALVVMSLCNHCPFVKHIREGLVKMVKEYQLKGIAFVAINSNDWEAYPDDSPKMMAWESKQYGYTFPYLYDQSQEVAKAYRAACTPDFFLFNEEGNLVYRGQMHDSRPGNGIPLTGKDLRAAFDALLAGKRITKNQKSSLGCNIKWRTGNEPEYFKQYSQRQLNRERLNG